MASRSGVYKVCSCVNIFLVLVQRSLYDTKNESISAGLKLSSQDLPQHPSVKSPNMCLQVCPTCSNIFALQVWAIVTKAWQSIFHHLLRFEQDDQLRVLVNEVFLIKVFVQLIWRCREYSIWLGSLEQFVSKPDRRYKGNTSAEGSPCRMCSRISCTTPAGGVHRYDIFGGCIQKRSSISLAPHKSSTIHHQHLGLLFHPVLCPRRFVPLEVVTPPGFEADHLALGAV